MNGQGGGGGGDKGRDYRFGEEGKIREEEKQTFYSG